jgi:hypothetical protein
METKIHTEPTAQPARRKTLWFFGTAALAAKERVRSEGARSENIFSALALQRHAFPPRPRRRRFRAVCREEITADSEAHTKIHKTNPALQIEVRFSSKIEASTFVRTISCRKIMP